jgi:outer membrane protein, heavy metal efflux system
LGAILKTSVLIGAVALMISGCASYTQLSVSESGLLKASLADLQTPVSALAEQSSKTQALNTQDGLSLSEIAILVALNNPSLKAERAKLAISRAQVLDASLFPDPQISLSFDHPTNAGPLDVNGWGAGLGYDLTSLFTRKPRLEASRERHKQLALDVLWQEWLTVQQAQFLAVRAIYNAQRLGLLGQMKALYEERYGLSDAAVKAGDITLDISGTNLTALLDVSSQFSQVQISQNRTLHTLKLSLGLLAGAKLDLQALPPTPAIHSEQFNIALKSLADRRPDLLALKAGVQNEDAKLRMAIRAQFPALNLGVNRLKDTAGLRTAGIGLNFSLPIFSRNRGQIARAKASRAQLQDAYNARLADAQSQTHELMANLDILHTQQAFLNTFLPPLKQDVDKTRSAFQTGDLGALTFLNMESTWISKQLERINIQQTQWETLLALQTLLALRQTTPTYMKNKDH